MLIGVALLALVAALVWIFEEGIWYLLGLAATTFVAWLYVTGRGSPWADAKALAITAPLVLLFVLLGAAAMARRAPAVGLSMLAMLSAACSRPTRSPTTPPSSLPTSASHELQSIGDRFAGQGAATTLDADEFAKHFLRDNAPSGAVNETDIDAVPSRRVESRPLIVRRRGATVSRPPANFRLAYRGRFYEVWVRSPGIEVLRHVPLGDGSSAVATPGCEVVRGLAREAQRAGAKIAAATGEPPLLLRPAALAALPRGWAVDPERAGDRRDGRAGGTIRGTVEAPRAGDTTSG